MPETALTTDLSESLQDYLEAVTLLVQRRGVARMKEIAALVGVGKSSATAAVRTLAERGLVHYEPYQYVTLTDDGERVGTVLLRRHRVLKRFLMEVLGVPEEEAERIGCKMEHVIKGQVLDRFVQFLRFAEEESCGGEALAQSFRRFLEKAHADRGAKGGRP